MFALNGPFHLKHIDFCINLEKLTGSIGEMHEIQEADSKDVLCTFTLE